MKLQTQGILFAITGALSASFFFVPYKIALETTEPLVFILAVYLVGFVISVLGSLVKREPGAFNRKTLWGAVIFALLSVVGNYAIGKSMLGIDPAITVVLTRVQVIMVMFMGWFFLKETLTPLLVPGAIIALIGFFWMNYSVETRMDGELSFYFWALGAALCFGVSQVIMKVIIHDISPMVVNHLRLLLGAGCMSLVPGVLQGLMSLELKIWVFAAVSALFGPTISRLSYMYSIRYIPVSQATLFILLTPVFTIVVSFLVLDIFPSTQQLIGGAIILLGISLPVSRLFLGRQPASRKVSSGQYLSS